MISIYLRELHRYAYDDLVVLFQCTNYKLLGYIKKLKEYNILKVVPFTKEQKDLTELNEEDIELISIEGNEVKYYYVFNYVGIIIIDSIVLKIYPKYIQNDTKPKKQLKQVLKVIEKFNNREQIIRIFNEPDKIKTYNPLAVCLYFLNDYFENGVYNNEVDILEQNGNGEIYWNKTINEAFAFIINGKPYYTSYYTKKRYNNEYDFFKSLHEVIITMCCKELKDADILDLFDFDEVYLSDKSIDEFGDTDYILYRLENEMNIQFNTRKNNLLKIMYTFIAETGTINNIDYLSMYGTNHFNMVWEKVCAKVLDNHLNTPLCELPLKNNIYDKDSGNLIDIIEKPSWIYKDDNEEYSHEGKTLIPDTIVINNDVMYIYDAKYYCLKFDKYNLQGQPGIESITKQYLYQLAYKDFVKNNDIKKIYNCFIMPTDCDRVIKKGIVRLKIMEEIGLENIQVRLLPAEEVYDCYLSNNLFPLNFI